MRRIAALFPLVLIAHTLAQPLVLDDFEDISDWQVITADGVELETSRVETPDGHAIRLDFDFVAGGGYCVIHKDLDLDLPENYRFSFRVRADAPDNNLEFKLVSADDVWWVVKRAYHFPTDWTRIGYKRRHLTFAWGPSGGTPLKSIDAIEFAISSSSGGKGSVYIDDLTFEPLPPDAPYTGTPTLSTSPPDSGVPAELPDDESVHWTPSEPGATFDMDFGVAREFSALELDWSGEGAVSYDVLTSLDGKTWDADASVKGSPAGTQRLFMPETEAHFLRIAVTEPGLRLEHVEVHPLDYASNWNEYFARVAEALPPGYLPATFLGRQTFWTVMGSPGNTAEALMNEDGQIELKKGGYSLEPFVRLNGNLLTWADALTSQSLEDGYLPIPTVRWTLPGASLGVTALASPGDPSVLIARYALTNTSDAPVKGDLLLALRPLQVLPPWQNLNITGGIGHVERLNTDANGYTIGGSRQVAFSEPARRFGVTSAARRLVTDYAAMGIVPDAPSIDDADALATGIASFPFALAPGETKTLVVSTPMDTAGPNVTPSLIMWDGRLVETATYWRQQLSRVSITLPDSGAQFRNTLYSNLAYILINRDGPAIQPGSRTYERAWIRDGAMTSAALLSAGHADEVVEYLDWYAAYQFDNGKIPCVVDHRGADPVDENDSCGEYIYAVWNCYEHTHDTEFLRRHAPHVRRAVDYLESLIARRSTPGYAAAQGLKGAEYGLVPESISHEGYSAKPMHSYWDDMFVLRGLIDAISIAEALGDSEDAGEYAGVRNRFRDSLVRSMLLATELHGINYIPGCVELGDFDATSTAIAVFPCALLGTIPEPQLHNTFDRYWDFFVARRDGEKMWRAYTPYELRLVNTFVRLGQPDRAHALLDFFFMHQFPPAWNHWAEVVHRNPREPAFIGDMPHTWVGSAFVNSAFSMFAYVHDGKLVLGAGLRPEWVESDTGAGIDGLCTTLGPVSYTVRCDGARTIYNLSVESWPEDGVWLANPTGHAVTALTIDGEPVDQDGGELINIAVPASEVELIHGS